MSLNWILLIVCFVGCLSCSNNQILLDLTQKEISDIEDLLIHDYLLECRIQRHDRNQNTILYKVRHLQSDSIFLFYLDVLSNEIRLLDETGKYVGIDKVTSTKPRKIAAALKDLSSLKIYISMPEIVCGKKSIVMSLKTSEKFKKIHLCQEPWMIEIDSCQVIISNQISKNIFEVSNAP